MAPTLLYSAVVGILTAAVYMTVGRRVGQRQLDGDPGRANGMFALWWWALGAITFTSALLNLAAYLGHTSVSLHTAITVVSVVALVAALWGLSYYLLYLYTGRRGLLAPLGAFYLLYLVFVLYVIGQAHPDAVVVGPWQARLGYANPAALERGPIDWLVILLVGPPILGAVAYFSLYFRVEDRTQRYRIAAIGASIAMWFGTAILASAAGWSDSDTWAVASRLIALTAALIVYSAFQPPRWMRRRYGLEPVAWVLGPPRVWLQTSRRLERAARPGQTRPAHTA